MFWFFKWCMLISLKVYFKKISLNGLENLPKDKPLIITPNHPSGFMDPILVGAILKRPVHFISRGESFLKPLQRWFFGSLHMIPVYRPEHTQHLVHKNKSSFKACYKVLQNNGAIIIFPEGLSHSDPQLIKTKTGAARIAFGAEETKQFNLDVHIVPVGLDYSNPHLFRSSVTINIGQPIPVAAYKNLYQNKPQKAVKALTEELRHSIIQRSVHIERNEHFHIHQLIVESQLFNGPERTEFLNTINHLTDLKLEKLKHVLYQIHYFKNKLKLKEAAHRPVKWTFSDYLWLPLAVLGVVLNYLPYKLSGWLTDGTIQRSDFRGSFLLTFGFFIFAFYLMSLGLVLGLLVSPLLALSIVLASLMGGYAWLRIHSKYSKWQSYIRYRSSLIKHPNDHFRYNQLKSEIRALLKVPRRKTA